MSSLACTGPSSPEPALQPLAKCCEMLTILRNPSRNDKHPINTTFSVPVLVCPVHECWFNSALGTRTKEDLANGCCSSKLAGETIEHLSQAKKHVVSIPARSGDKQRPLQRSISPNTFLAVSRVSRAAKKESQRVGEGVTNHVQRAQLPTSTAYVSHKKGIPMEASGDVQMHSFSFSARDHSHAAMVGAQLIPVLGKPSTGPNT